MTARELSSNPGPSNSLSAGEYRGGKSACDQTPEEVQLRVAGRKRSRLLWQWQDVQETVVALYFPRTDDPLGLGLEAVV